MGVQPCSDHDDLLTDFGKRTLRDRYLLDGEEYQGLFVRVAESYSNDEDHAQRLYSYMARHWFMPATPILANGGTDRGLPISCYLNSVEDDMSSILDSFKELGWLSCRGGGVGTYWGAVREVGSKVKGRRGAEGIVPFLQIQNSYTKAMNQGTVRGASSAFYIEIDHPEIEQYIEIRKPTGGDPSRKTLYSHHGVIVNDKFMWAVINEQPFDLISRVDGSVVQTVDARKLWASILKTRMVTGEPYIMFQDAIDQGAPEVYKKLGLKVKQSNLCTEITLATGRDHHSNLRTAVCCLSSLNLEKFDEWKDDDQFILDVMYFLDNVLEDFINRASDMEGFEKAVHSARSERAVGLGVMGFHGYLMSKMIPVESPMSIGQNKKIFAHIKEKVDEADRVICDDRGPCPDAIDAGLRVRFSHKTAIAPTATISVICGGATPGVEMVPANKFVHKTDSGSFVVVNKYLKNLLESAMESGRIPEIAEGMTVNDYRNKFWREVSEADGSVQWCEWMTDHERSVFKTAFEVDQKWIVDLAADRGPKIDQAQSVNLFFAGDADRRYVNSVHMRAYEKGLKTLYYCRSSSVVSAKTVGHDSIGSPIVKSEECEVCQ